MAASRSQRHQPVDHVQAGLVSSLTSLFSQKINSTEELKKVPVVKPTPRRNPLAQKQADNSHSHLGFTQVGKPALIQLVQAQQQHENQQHQQHQQHQHYQHHQQYQQGPFATKEWTVYETLPVAPDSQHSQRQSYVTKKTKYSTRSALGGDQADVASSATASAAVATTAPVPTPAASAAADKYRLEEWIVYETLPVDMGGAATAAAKEDRLERIRRQEAEQRRLKAEFEEKKASRRQMEAVRTTTSRATPEMFSKEEWTVYETVPAEPAVRRSASSGRESRTVQKQQQYQQQQQQHQYQMRQMRSESSDSAIGYRRYLDERNSSHQGAAENATRGTKKTAMTATTTTKTVNTVQSGGGSRVDQSHTSGVRTRRVDTPEVFSKEEWTVYETVPAAAAHESQYYRSEKQQQQQSQQQNLQQQRRNVRWSSVADQQQLQVVAARKTPEVYSKEEWTVYETVPSTAVQPTQSEHYQQRQHQRQHQQQHQQQHHYQQRQRETLYRSPSEESVLGYRRYLDQPATESTSKSITKRSNYQVGGSSSKYTETRREERRQTSARDTRPPPPQQHQISAAPPPMLRQSAGRFDVGRASTPIRTEEWTVVHRVPIEEELRWVDTGGRRVAKETVWRQQASGSPAGYKRYVIGSTASLAGEDIVEIGYGKSRRRHRLGESDDSDIENPFHNGFYVTRDNPIYSGH